MKVVFSIIFALLLGGGENGADPERNRPVVIGMGGVCWDHLRHTSPGSLEDDELKHWGYEPDWADSQFVEGCREAVKNPIELITVGEGKHLVMLKFPTYYHAKAVLAKLHMMGKLQTGIRNGFPAEVREEGRCLLVGAARGFHQLKEQVRD